MNGLSKFLVHFLTLHHVRHRTKQNHNKIIDRCLIGNRDHQSHADGGYEIQI